MGGIKHFGYPELVEFGAVNLWTRLLLLSVAKGWFCRGSAGSRHRSPILSHASPPEHSGSRAPLLAPSFAVNRSDNLIRFLREIPRIARGETLANDRHKQPDLGVSKGVLQLAGPPPCVGIEKGLVDSWIDFADL